MYSVNAMIPGSGSLFIVRHHQDPCLLYVIHCTRSCMRDDDDDHDEYYEKDPVNIIYIRALLSFPILFWGLVTHPAILKGFLFIKINVNKTKRLRYKSFLIKVNLFNQLFLPIFINFFAILILFSILLTTIP